jgi:predicted Fe-S protein YdhL (DUF1289 family)
MIASPCINVCRMEGNVCAGCFRTLDEIGRWGNAGDNEKELMLAAVAQRRSHIEADLFCNCSD